MQGRLWRKTGAAWRGIVLWRCLAAAAGSCVLAACTTDGQSIATSVAPRGASVAFESIDGPPQAQFYRLVQDLNDEAQSRRLDVVSREHASEYRVRGYLAAEVAKGEPSISWVWDVFDADGHRALRIEGAEAAAGKRRNAWDAADDALLHRIASASMERLAAFLTSPDVAPAPTASLASFELPSSPEAAGIFRIFQPAADPVSATEPAPNAAEAPAVPVPLPPRRPTISAALVHHETVAIAASER